MTRYPRAARNAALKCVPCGAPLVRTTDDRYVCVECGETPIESRSRSRPVLHVEKSVETADRGDVRLEYVFDPKTDDTTYFKAIDALPQAVDHEDVRIETESPAGLLRQTRSAVKFSGILQGEPLEAAVSIADAPVDDAAFSDGPAVEAVYTQEAKLRGNGGVTDGGSEPGLGEYGRSNEVSSESDGVTGVVPFDESGSTSSPGNGHGRSSNGHATNGGVTGVAGAERQPAVESAAPSAERGSPDVLVAIPAYNEARSIADVVRDASGYADDVLVVDDGSDDETAARAESAGASTVEHPTNRGYGAAIKTIFQEAYRLDAEHLVIIDGDGQHDPSDVPELVDTQRSTGAEIVIGSRFVDGAETEMPFYRHAGLAVINQLINLSFGVVRERSRVADTQSGFRAYDRRAIRSLAHDVRIGDGMDASIDILFHAHQQDYRIEEVPTTVSYDVADANNKNPLFHGYQLVKNALRTLEHERPILLLGIPGFVLVFVGVAAGFLSVGEFLQTGSLSVELAVPAVLFTLFGTFAAFTAIILHSLNAFKTATMGRLEADSVQRR